MAKHPIEDLERHRQRDRPHRGMLLLDASVTQAGVHGSHDGNVVHPFMSAIALDFCTLLSLKTTSTVMLRTQVAMS